MYFSDAVYLTPGSKAVLEFSCMGIHCLNFLQDTQDLIDLNRAQTERDSRGDSACCRKEELHFMFYHLACPIQKSFRSFISENLLSMTPLYLLAATIITYLAVRVRCATPQRGKPC